MCVLSLCACRICHCEGDDECPLIMPCRCTGSLSFVHQACLNQWIKSSDTRCCELCKFDFIMETKLKPLRKVGSCSESSLKLSSRHESVTAMTNSNPCWLSSPLHFHPSLLQWEKLHMSKSERRKIFCSVLFHLIAIVCMLWSVYVLVKRTAEEIRLGKNGEYSPHDTLHHTPESCRVKQDTFNDSWRRWRSRMVQFKGTVGAFICKTLYSLDLSVY